MPAARRGRSGSPNFALLLAFGLVCAIALAPATASGKEIADFFGGSGSLGGQFGSGENGSQPGGVAVNTSGAGPANAGDVYATDPNNNRIERFGRDDKGTPSLKDDTYFFISAWGADVASPSGGSSYEICTVAAECRPALASGGNGALNAPRGVAVDQDSGRVYVSDAGNSRVNVYEGDGAFVRSFGYDVAGSGPGHLAAPNEKQQLTVKATGGKFSLYFAGATTGGAGTGRVNPDNVVTEVKVTSGSFAVGQAFTAVQGKSLFPPGSTITGIEGQNLIISQPSGTSSGNPNTELFGDDLPYNASAAQVEAALNALPTIGGVGGSVTVTGGPGNGAGSSPYVIEFGGTLAGEGVPSITTSAHGLAIGSGTPSAAIETLAQGGAYEVCVAADGDVCKAGSIGPGTGQVGETRFLFNKAPSIAISAPDGNPASGSVFLADPGNQRVNTYALDGSGPASIGSAAVFQSSEGRNPSSVAVDSRGILYAGNGENGTVVQRYDTENADGGGIGFLAPIPVGVNEKQQIAIAATAGAFRLTFEGQTTADIPYNATSSQFQAALEALPSVGKPNNFACCGSFGGPGNAEGSNPYSITFARRLGAKDVPQVVVSNGSVPLSGGAGASVTTPIPGQPGLIGTANTRLAVDPDEDGAGPDADVLYASRGSVIQQFGPLNAPGLSASPTLDDARHNTLGVTQSEQGIAADPTSGRIFVAAGGSAGSGIYLTGEVGPSPTASLDSLSGITSHSVIAHATINPNGPPDTSYHFEYSLDGTNWKSTPTVVLGRQESPQAIEATIGPPLFGLAANTLYHLRLVYQRLFSVAATTPELTFTTNPAGPLAETLGSPLRSTTTVQLDARVSPSNSPASFHFEYGNEGPCDANPCTSSPDRAAGTGSSFKLVSERLEGLEAGTAYHYRVVASNGIGAPVAGSDMTATTLASEAPLSHGHFPGPPGSDRAWEMASIANSGGNPASAQQFSAEGDRLLYGVTGGTPIADAGSPYSQYFAQRTPTGWQSQVITPSREQLVGPEWTKTQAAEDLSLFAAVNTKTGDPRRAVWGFGPGAQPVKLFEAVPPQILDVNWLGASADASVVAAIVQGGSLDPAYPKAAARQNLYEISSGDPQLISLLPDETVAACGLDNPAFVKIDAARPVSADGRFVFFPSQGNGPCGGSAPSQLYMRDLQAGETKLISPPSVSGPECDAAFIKSTPGAAFFWTQSRLVAEDTAPGGCGTSGTFPDGDVYRYDTGDGSLECTTCVAAGLDADVSVGFAGAAGQIGVAEDGSRVYFRSTHALLPGALEGGGVYRIKVATGDLAYAGPIDGNLGGLVATPDSAVLLFSSADADLNPLGTGTDNGASSQIYRYDDDDRSIACISCPFGGSAPVGPVPSASPVAALNDDGDVLAFATPTALVGADQNTAGPGQEVDAGQDVYEWRDGRLFLISDGLSNWSRAGTPFPVGVSPSGRDIFFNAWAQYTPDALDAYQRVYDARLGGGFEFPKPPPPCPLEVCQGTPKGAPDEQAPGTGAFAGPGNATSAVSCRKPKVRRKGRCVAKKPKARHHRRAANRHRRAHR